ncbi:MAG: 4-hydroxythreonine-4-phosphate dehydrogenase PdxA [Candidatus Hydrogenedentes bacterium]|nr:4-hydroxythreonine-4-phosphate dehydrogenase PdxA [Candidatus Hydrogenedentota bacterium]
MLSTSSIQKPRIAITMGDVNGIGPEILAKALSRDEVFARCEPIVYGAVETLRAARQALGLPAPERDAAIATGECAAPLLDPGTIQPDAGRAALSWIRAAISDAMRGVVDAVVTCPINKECIHLAGSSALGHTEMLVEMTGAAGYRMSLFSDRMRIVHVTGHLPLADAIAQVKKDRIAETIRIAHFALERLPLSRRRIAVAGLNPHAGEGGLLGAEEAREIGPAVDLCRSEAIDCAGPYPPDTVFRRMDLGEFDLVVAMYHDQGHIPLKLIAMDEGVQVTLGIPIVRTSVDHGTAYDIAWKGTARENSLVAAIQLAVQFVANRGHGVVR